MPLYCERAALRLVKRHVAQRLLRNCDVTESDGMIFHRRVFRFGK
jgi:hypothetical protein